MNLMVCEGEWVWHCVKSATNHPLTPFHASSPSPVPPHRPLPPLRHCLTPLLTLSDPLPCPPPTATSHSPNILFFTFPQLFFIAFLLCLFLLYQKKTCWRQLLSLTRKTIQTKVIRTNRPSISRNLWLLSKWPANISNSFKTDFPLHVSHS